MPNPGLEQEKAVAFINAVETALRAGHTPPGVSPKAGSVGALAAACEALGINKGSGTGRLRAAILAHREPDWTLYASSTDESRQVDSATFELPTFSDDDISAEEILEHLEKRFAKKLNADKERHWFSIRVPDNQPIGLAVIGDPHLGSSCNIPLLKRDVAILANTPGMMAVNIGDTADNWGRLIHLYAEDDISRPTERKLARWFLAEAGVPWCVWLHGNHDTMHSEFATYLKSANVNQIPMLDWRARFQLEFPASTVRIDAAHNHKGTSVYNRLHGQKRAALWDEDADIYVSGHHHTWGLAQEEMDDGRVIWMARARGYKWLDSFATRHGFHRDEYGATILFVIDPVASNPVNRIAAFCDLEQGAEFLTWKRSQRARA